MIWDIQGSTFPCAFDRQPGEADLTTQWCRGPCVRAGLQQKQSSGCMMWRVMELILLLLLSPCVDWLWTVRSVASLGPLVCTVLVATNNDTLTREHS